MTAPGNRITPRSVCIMCHSIGPYHAARFRALSAVTNDFRVVQLATEQKEYLWRDSDRGLEKDVDVITLFHSPVEGVGRFRLATAVERQLELNGPEVVVSAGYSNSGMRAAARWARRNGKMSIMITDTWAGDKKRFGPKEFLKGRWCRKMYDGLFLSGSRSRDYFIGLGVPQNKIRLGVDVVDNRPFQEGADLARKNALETRPRLGLPESFFICVARHSPEKNLPRLLDAFKSYQERGGRWGLVLAGDGPLRRKLENKAERFGLRDVKFVGWLDYEILPTYYGLAGALILPSISEPWGLAVNEAMASGLPVLVSRKCGCGPELCSPGINGYMFDPSDTEEMSGVMSLMAKRENELLKLGKASQDMIRDLTPQTWASSLMGLIKSVS